MDDEIQHVTIPGGQARVPVAVALNGNGPRFVVGAPGSGEDRIAPEECDHAGYSWSTEFYLRCGRCGAPLVLPPGVIARKSVETIRLMAEAWEAAGRPGLGPVKGEDGQYRWGWRLGEQWVLREHRLFEHLGGLPIRKIVLATGENFSDGDEDGEE